jgi:hypothetical protein
MFSANGSATGCLTTERNSPSSEGRFSGAIAQLAERLLCKQEVRGSNPRGSTSQNASVLIMDGGVRAINVQLGQRAGRAVVVLIVGPLRLDPGVQRVGDLAVGQARTALRGEGVPVWRRVANGRYTLTVNIPRVSGALSLRAQAWGAAGSRVAQTVIDAYGLSGH